MELSLSVCPSRSGIVPKQTYRHSVFTTQYPDHSSFISIKHLRDIPTGSLLRGRYKYRRDTKILRFSTNRIDEQTANDTRQHHSYYGTLIGTRMRSIERCHSNDLERALTLFSLMLNISKTAIVTIGSEQETALKLSNGTSFNDLERALTLFSRSHHSLTLNISQTATYGHSLQKANRKPHSSFRMHGTSFNDLE